MSYWESVNDKVTPSTYFEDFVHRRQGTFAMLRSAKEDPRNGHQENAASQPEMGLDIHQHQWWVLSGDCSGSNPTGTASHWRIRMDLRVPEEHRSDQVQLAGLREASIRGGRAKVILTAGDVAGGDLKGPDGSRINFMLRYESPTRSLHAPFYLREEMFRYTSAAGEGVGSVYIAIAVPSDLIDAQAASEPGKESLGAGDEPTVLEDVLMALRAFAQRSAADYERLTGLKHHVRLETFSALGSTTGQVDWSLVNERARKTLYKEAGE